MNEDQLKEFLRKNLRISVELGGEDSLRVRDKIRVTVQLKLQVDENTVEVIDQDSDIVYTLT